MSNNPLKSIFIVGEIKNDRELTYKLCPDYFNILVGVWEIALADIAINLNIIATQNSIFEISSNLVQGFVYNNSGQLTKNNVVLGRFEISPDKYRGLQTFGVNKFFTINNHPSEIKLYFKEWPSDSTLRANPRFKVSVNLILQRIE